MTMAFTGGNAPGLAAETTPSTADIAVVVNKTGVERLPDGNWSFRVAVANDNGNNCTPADNSRAVLLLPPDCQVISVTAKRADGTDASWTQCGAYIEVQVGELCPANNAIGQPAIITVLLKPSPYKGSACIPAFGALVFSGRPDHVPGNNAWWWREHCTGGMTYFPQEQPLPSKGR
ncbi:MAG: hypothetical protein MUE88_10540 [Flavobacteriales bacterium]|jgi:hypothetical protein|nr:hypothetical protein [Flavobacteriales bacterium]